VKYNSLKGHEGSVKSLAFLPSRRIFYSSGADGKILRWDLDRSGARPQVLINNNFSNRSLSISSNGRWLACGTGTSSIQVFNLNQPNTEPELKQGHQGAVVDLAFIEGKDMLVSMGSDKSLILWNLLTGSSKTIVTHSSRIRVITISKDGKYVFGGTDDGKLMRWTISSGESKLIFDNRNTSILTMALNRNGSRIALGDKSGNIIILDANAGRVISRRNGHSSRRVEDISYSPDNTQLATSSMDGTIKIWNARDLSETPIVITAHEEWVFALAFSPDGRSIVSSSENGVIFFWSTRTKYLADEMCNVITRNFTDQEWDIYVGMDVNYQKTCANK
jgi:WD40 repeat protein